VLSPASLRDVTRRDNAIRRRLKYSLCDKPQMSATLLTCMYVGVFIILLIRAVMPHRERYFVFDVRSDFSRCTYRLRAAYCSYFSSFAQRYTTNDGVSSESRFRLPPRSPSRPTGLLLIRNSVVDTSYKLQYTAVPASISTFAL